MGTKNNNLVLIIDDNPGDLRSLGNLIKDQGDILVATSGVEGLMLAEQRRPDLVITDLFLTDYSGIEICEKIKANPHTQDCEVIVVTATESESLEVCALEAGAVDFITKPYRAPVVRARVKTHLSLSRHKNLLQVLADKDGLTEVFNRRYFEKQARIELKRHYRQQQPLTLALLDIDHFKAYNDAYGHLQGDLCLREVAQAIESVTRRPGEVVTRYGGEEFAIILPNTNTHNAKKYGRWICEQVLSLAIPHNASSTIPFVTLSAGIATVTPSSDTTLETLLMSADSALYLAKESGRNQFKVATLEHAAIKEAG